MTNLLALQGIPYLACLLMLAILAYVGIHVLKREIIFIDIALAQIAVVGAIAANVAFSLHGDSLIAQAIALAVTLVAAAFFALIRRRVHQIPLEAIIGVSYAIAAAAALFLVGISPGGHTHVQSMLSGSILWATRQDVVGSASILGAIAVVFFVFRRQFQAISDDYEDAAARGLRTVGWDFLFYALVSIVITTVVRIGGVVVVFSFLIIPPAAATLVSGGWTRRLLISWQLGALAAAVGLLFADRHDFSVGPSIALWLGVMLVGVALLRRGGVPPRSTFVATTILLVGSTVLFAAGNPVLSGNQPSASSDVPAGSGEAPGHGPLHHGLQDPSESVVGSSGTSNAMLDETDLVSIIDPDRLMELYDRRADPYERSLVVLRLLQLDRRSGLDLGRKFLASDPPLLFRGNVVDALDEAFAVESGYDTSQPFDAPGNTSAVSRWQEALEGP